MLRALRQYYPVHALPQFHSVCALRQCHIPTRAQAALMGGHCKKMYSSSAVEIVNHKLQNSTSLSGYAEGIGLKIRIIDKDSFSEAMGIDETTEPLPPSATDLYLDEFGPDQILNFRSANHPELSEKVRRLLVRLRIAIIHNDITKKGSIKRGDLEDGPRDEKYIDDMAIELMNAVQFNDAQDLLMFSCSLRLTVGMKNYAVNANREGRRGSDVIWIMQENKRISDNRYRKDDIQLASCMIAAYQRNFISLGRVYPESMFGIKIVADEVFFYAMKMTESYLQDLTRSAPGEDVEVFKYPGYRGLRITVPEERKQILRHMWSMSRYAVGLGGIGSV